MPYLGRGKIGDPMKKFLFLSVVTTACCLVGCNHEPSRKDTLQWMHDFLAEHSGDSTVVGDGVWRTSYSLESDGCKVTLTDLEERKSDPQRRDYKEIYQFSLSELDPTTAKFVKAEYGSFADVGTRDKRSVIHMWEDGKDYPQWSLRIVFSDDNDAYRFAKAMKHAVELCGGKPSTF